MIAATDIINQYSTLFSFQTFIVASGLFMRLSALAFFLPGLGERAVPVRVRLVGAAALAFVLFPFVESTAPLVQDYSVTRLLIVLAAEVVNGLLLGFAARIFVFILQLAGAMIAQNLSLSQLFGPTVGFDSESPFASMLVMAGLGVAVASGLHFHFAGAIGSSFEILRFGEFPGGAETAEWSVARTGAAFLKAFALASPFVLLGFLYSIALSAASRAMPQLPAAFVGAPMITFAGLVLFAAAAPLILIEWLGDFQAAVIDLFTAQL